MRSASRANGSVAFGTSGSANGCQLVVSPPTVLCAYAVAPLELSRETEMLPLKPAAARA